MAQILNNISITTSINKVLETTEGFILNGHYYDKKTMTPQPLTSFNPTGIHDDICVSKRIIKSYTHDTYQSVENYGRESLTITDSYDPDTTYVICEASSSTTMAMHVLKITEKEGYATQVLRENVNTSYYTTSIYHRIYDIIGQSQDFIYVLGSSVNVASGSTSTYGQYSAILSINKVTLQMAVVEQFAKYYIASKVAESPLYSFIFIQGDRGNISCKRFNKSTGKSEIATITNTPGTIAYHHTQASNGLQLEDGRFLVYSFSDINGVSTFTKRIIDPEDDSLLTCAKYDENTVEYTVREGLSIESLPMLPSNGKNRYQLEITKNNGKNYLNVFLYDISMSVTANIGHYGIYTFLINADYSLELCGFSPIPGVIPFGYTTNYKKDGVLTCCADSLRYYLFNSENECWKETYVANSTIASAGFDMAGNIWYIDSNSNVEMISPTNPVSISLSMENNSYQFDGSDIDTNVVINAVNMDNEKIPAKIKMTLKGSALFTSTNTKVITVNTLKGEDLKVPVTIKDGGQIIIYPELLI